ncbi:hypothetical protein K461DRAFT_65216 [Myriangium duriaei CBS 260.36]|uniref:2EXR domain-containing protein n=1 Tax=Myriangium duriaei CBS 260.36 TaxID=1168546 RepID=A0A9P4MG23_9PEZI|nr:hypothetical protein K461DRAFT_65216 [Myriangium duriaei CBS 260.36]
MSYSQFHFFSRLPLELRQRIWSEALPDPQMPAIYQYGPAFRHSQEAKIATPRTRINIRFDLPLMYVNREARQAALDWNTERSFDANRDVVYLGEYYWTTLFDRRPCVTGVNEYPPLAANISQVAIDERLLHHEAIECFVAGTSAIKALYIICDAPDQISQSEYWELGPSYGGTFVYCARKLEFEFRSNGSDCLNSPVRPWDSDNHTNDNAYEYHEDSGYFDDYEDLIDLKDYQATVFGSSEEYGDYDRPITRYEQLDGAAAHLKELFSILGFKEDDDFDGFEIRPISIVARSTWSPSRSRSRSLDFMDRYCGFDLYRLDDSESNIGKDGY